MPNDLNDNAKDSQMALDRSDNSLEPPDSIMHASRAKGGKVHVDGRKPWGKTLGNSR